MLRNKKSGELITENSVLAQYPNTSFPTMKNETFWNGLGYDILYEGIKPTCDALKQHVLKPTLAAADFRDILNESPNTETNVVL